MSTYTILLILPSSEESGQSTCPSLTFDISIQELVGPVHENSGGAHGLSTVNEVS